MLQPLKPLFKYKLLREHVLTYVVINVKCVLLDGEKMSEYHEIKIIRLCSTKAKNTLLNYSNMLYLFHLALVVPTIRA